MYMHIYIYNTIWSNILNEMFIVEFEGLGHLLGLFSRNGACVARPFGLNGHAVRNVRPCAKHARNVMEKENVGFDGLIRAIACTKIFCRMEMVAVMLPTLAFDWSVECSCHYMKFN